jgi:hypothetical protein
MGAPPFCLFLKVRDLPTGRGASQEHAAAGHCRDRVVTDWRAGRGLAAAELQHLSQFAVDRLAVSVTSWRFHDIFIGTDYGS